MNIFQETGLKCCPFDENTLANSKESLLLTTLFDLLIVTPNPAIRLRYEVATSSSNRMISSPRSS